MAKKIVDLLCNGCGCHFDPARFGRRCPHCGGNLIGQDRATVTAQINRDVQAAEDEFMARLARTDPALHRELARQFPRYR